MKTIKKTVTAPAALLIAVLCMVIAYQAGASRPVVQQRSPAVIATVNLPKVLEGLAQRSQAEAKLESMHADFQQERDRREKEIRQLEENLKDLSEKHREGGVPLEELQPVADQLDLQRVNFQVWANFMVEKFDLEQALLMQDLYREVKKAIAAMAEVEGFDLVIFDTSGGELSFNPEVRVTRTKQIEQQILSRGVLYAAQPLDITNHLVERMNNQFRAAQASQ